MIFYIYILFYYYYYYFFLFFSLCLKDDLENAKYISRLFAARHKFYKQNKICTE